MQDIQVSVVCNAYNHEKYIRDALEGFVMQKTNFPFEVLIHDDASTDRTADIIREYEQKYPKIIKPIYETENQYSKGDGSLARIQYGRVKGKYIALCEGDDYWTDPNKLQKQYDALEANEQVDICSHFTLIRDAKTNANGGKFPNKRYGATAIPVEDVIRGGGGFVGTNSLMYRAYLHNNEPDFRKILRLDYTIQILGSLKGGMLFIPEEMSVYRRAVEGSWTKRMENDSRWRKQHTDRVEAMLRSLDEYTGGRYHGAIDFCFKRHLFTQNDHEGHFKEMLSPEFRQVRKELPAGQKIELVVKVLFPKLVLGKRASRKNKK